MFQWGIPDCIPFFMLKQKIPLNFLLSLLSYKYQYSIGINKIQYGISFMKRAEHYSPVFISFAFPLHFCLPFCSFVPVNCKQMVE